MGLFYANLAVYRPEREALALALRRLDRAAFIGPTTDGRTVVYDKVMDEQNSQVIELFGCGLTLELSCAALAAVLHDDDVLYLWLFDRGRVRDRYDSLPGYFGDAELGPPAGGDARRICEAFDRADRAGHVERLLRADLLAGELPDVPGELGRHAALAAELRLPPEVAGLGYSAIAGGYIPEQFQGVTFERVSEDD